MPITPSGYETTDLATIKSEVEQVFKDALGEDLILDAETPQGNLIAEITDILHQIDLERQNDFYARDLYHAEGVQLDILGRELDIPRRAAIPTQVLITLEGAVNFTILKGTKAAIITDSSKVFEFTSDVTITSASQQVTLEASDSMIYDNLTAGMQLQTQEYVPQIYSMTVDTITYGQPAESDYQYRIRLIASKSSNVDEVKHLTLALENVPNVLSAYVEPNNTLETSTSGIPPHAVEIVVLGGDESDIANTIMGYIFATPTYKDPTLGVEITGIDYNGHLQTFYITRPAQKTVTVTVNYTNKQGMTLSTADKADLTTKVLGLVNSTYMNKTLYRSDVCNLLTSGYTQTYAIDSVVIEIDGSEMTNSYTCSAREYLYSASVEFVESV